MLPSTLLLHNHTERNQRHKHYSRLPLLKMSHAFTVHSHRYNTVGIRSRIKYQNSKLFSIYPVYFILLNTSLDTETESW